MKKHLAWFLCLLLMLSSCSAPKEYESHVTFYYCTAEPSYSDGSTTIRSESRDRAAMDNLEDILQVYLAGPESEDLTNPFPAGLSLVSVLQEDSTVFITVTDALAELTTLYLTMACGCITLTCLELTGAEQVCIEAEDALLNGQKSITMDRTSLQLQDTAVE